MLQENPALIDWDDLENENIDPLDLDELPELPKSIKKEEPRNQTKWILQYKDKHYLCPIKLHNLAYYIHWIMKWREKQKYSNKNFVWIKCNKTGNEIFDYNEKVVGFRSTKTFQKKRYLLEYFLRDVVYRRIRPLPEKVLLGKAEKKRVKDFFVVVGQEKISLGKRFLSDFIKPLSEFSSNKHVEVIYLEKGKEKILQYSDFHSRERKRRSERIVNSGEEIASIIKKSLKEQGLLEK